MEKKEIIIMYHQNPDGTYSRTIGMEGDSYAFVAMEIIGDVYNELKKWLNTKAQAEGYQDLADAGKDWALEQKIENVMPEKEDKNED